MRVFCVATLDNYTQIDNLCDQVRKIGGEPTVCLGDVTVEYEGNKEKCEKIMELFEQYTRHGIYTNEES